MRRRALGWVPLAAAAVTLGFLLLPIAAIFVRTGPGALLDQLSNPVVQDAFVVTLKTSGVAQALILLLGTPTAYLLATRRFRGRPLAVVLVELPLVLPPAVAGLGLFAAFGRMGLLGSTLDAFGVSIPFTQTAVTLAVAYVASPLYIRQAMASFEALDPTWLDASRTLGATEARTFTRIAIPAAGPGLLAGLALAFLALPIVGIFVHTSPGNLLDQLSNPVVRDAFVVSIKTSAFAQVLILLLGTPTAFLLATRRFPGHSLAVTLVELPLVLPPAVAGIGLLAAFGHTTGLLHTSIPFTQTAVVFAVVFVASPLYIRQAIAAFEAVDPNLVAASRTLGAGPGRTFFRVVLPLARNGLAAGEALAFARGLGEFGATIMFAGSLQGVTQTLSLAIYQEFDLDFDSALAISALLVLVSGILLVFFLLLDLTNRDAMRILLLVPLRRSFRKLTSSSPMRSAALTSSSSWA